MVNDDLPQYEANMSSVTIRAMWRFARSAVDDAQVGLGFLLSDFLESIPNFAGEADDYDMVRAANVEDSGSPSIFHWAGDQDWLTF